MRKFCYDAGMTPKPIKISVFLDPTLQRAVKVAAMEDNTSISKLVADLVAREYSATATAKKTKKGK